MPWRLPSFSFSALAFLPLLQGDIRWEQGSSILVNTNRLLIDLPTFPFFFFTSIDDVTAYDRTVGDFSHSRIHCIHRFPV